ncbi:hypothetical protein EJB05_25726, partial [Eragrostis curvula]
MDLATGAIGNLVPKLLQLLRDEYKLPKNVRKQIQFLSGELQSYYAALRKVAEVPPEQLDEQVKVWARDVRELSYDVEDVVDTFLVRVSGREPADPSRRRRAKMKMSNLFRKAKNHRDIADADDIAGAIKDIMERLEEVAARRARALYTEAKEFVGIERPRDMLIGRMMSSENDEGSNKKMMTVSVVGVGGLGKTTLVKAVYDKLKLDFDCGAFVSIGRAPDMKRVFKQLLLDLDKKKYQDIDNAAQYEERVLVKRLQEFLKNKRYFFVIDDIWEHESWKKIKDALPENNSGSIVMTTTRNLNVAEESSTLYMLHPLSDEDSKKLFYSRIFGEEVKSFHNQRYDVSDQILKKCGGIPLAIITMASLLVNRPREQWSEVLSHFGFGHKDTRQVGNAMKILSYSYYDMPSHLQPCLLYLSAFPEDYVIEKDTLIWKWIGEGFVHEEQGICLFEIGEKYFSELINRSMIQPVESQFDGAIQGCRVHDMVLGLLICSISNEENFVSVLDDDNQKFRSGRVHRRLALQNRNEEQSIEDNMGFGQLRSLNATGCPMYMIRQIPNFRLLRVLDLESCGSREGYNIEHLGTLLHLRFLGLRNTLVHKLPEEMGHLRVLQTLMLEGSGVEELPESMCALTQLMCLNTDWKMRVPSWIGKFTSLQQLKIYPGGGDDELSSKWFVKELGKLTQLRMLRFIIKVQDERQIRDLLESISNLHNLRVIHFDYYGVQFNNANVLEPAGFVISAHLRFMELRWLEFSSLPVWINPHDLPNLCHLWLMLSDVGKQDIETLGGLPELSYLHLMIANTERGEIITCSVGAFQRLKFCSITKPLKFQYGAMPRLHVLDFHFNVRLLRDADHDFDFDFGLGNLSSLKHVTIESNCLAAFPEEVREAEAALRRAVDVHPNRLTIEIRWFGQTMKTSIQGVLGKDHESKTMMQ